MVCIHLWAKIDLAAVHLHVGDVTSYWWHWDSFPNSSLSIRKTSIKTYPVFSNMARTLQALLPLQNAFECL